MVAVVSGSGLGLFGTTGASGSAASGRGGERVFINTATGNLVIQGVDETLAARGLDLALVRTYNSQGLLNDDNGDNWRLGVHRRVYALSGTVNTAGSTITKVFGDAAEVVYTYDVALGRYVSTDGDGAHDTLTFASSQWAWTDETSRNTETYDSQGRLTASRDADGNLVSYIYTGALLTQIVDASGQQTFLDYTGNNLTQVRVISDGATQTLTRYAYDAQNRLSTVTVDLSPEDNAVSDGNTYITSYTYDGTSPRVASITQTDGSSCAFTYQLIDGEYRVATYTDGEGRVTTLEYSQAVGGGSTGPVEVDADEDALLTTEAQSTTTDYELDVAELSTTDTESVDTDYELDGGELTTNGTQTDTYDRDDAALVATGAQTIPQSFNLAPGLLTPSAGGSWETEVVLESSNVSAFNSHIGYANNGDAVTAWRQGNSVYVRRYIAASDTWQSAVAISAGAFGVTMVHLAVDSVTGSAAIAWTQNLGAGESIFMSYMDASGNWTAATAAELEPGTVTNWEEMFSVSVSGTHAAVTFVQAVGGEANIYFTRMNNGVASAAVLVDSLALAGQFPQVAIDSSGNATVVWRQDSGTGAQRAYQNRWSATTQSFSGAALLDTHVDGSRFPQIAFDAQGNGIAIWRQLGGVHARHFNATTGTWGPAIALQSLTNDAAGFRLAVDSAGNALVGWMQSDSGGIASVYANRYSASTGTWGGATLVETASAPAGTDDYVAVAINGDYAVASWMQSNGSDADVYAARFAGGVWSAPQLMESREETPGSLGVGIDTEGHIGLTWIQADGAARSPWIKRFVAVDDGGPYYTVPAGATWQSLANTLYGIGSAAAGTALQAAMGNPALTTGAHLTDWPAVLTFTTTISNHTLDIGGLSPTPGGSWATGALLESSNVSAFSSYIGYANNGDAVTVWRQGNSVYVRRYIAATDTWQNAVAISAGAFQVTMLRLAVDAVTGSAAIAWTQNLGDADSLFMSYMNASGSWTVATAAESGSGAVSIGEEQFGVSVAGAHAAVTFIQNAGGERNIYLTRMNDGTASAAAVVDALTADGEFPQVAIDSSGNATVVWRQNPGTGSQRAYQNRWNSATQSLEGAVLLDTHVDGSRFPQIAFDAQGNGIAIWRQSGGLHARHFTASSGTWGSAIALQTLTNNADGFRLAVDSAGNALVGWVQHDAGGIASMYANRFSVSTGTWGGATLLESSSEPLSTEDGVAVAISGDNAVAAWLQSNGDDVDVYAARLAGGVWSMPELMESREESPSNLSVGIDAERRIGLTWIQPDGAARSPWIKRFVGLPPHYPVPAGATWQSIANALYDVDSPLAGDALQAAMGNPALTIGAQLTGWPPVLTVIPAAIGAGPSYYLVPAGATWQSIANAVYGVNSAAAGAALQTALGNPALTTGAQLTGFPATLSVVSNLAPHYIVPAAATWRSVANALYGVDSNEAGAALQAALGNPALDTGALLFNIPETLTVTTVATVTVAAYYTIASGDTWAPIATLLYGNAAAASALQTALGNPTLTPGNRLTGLPEELSVTTEGTVTVPAYFLVEAGDTCASITLAVYGTDDSNAVQALQSALPGVTLSAGLHLTVPGSLTYTPVNGETRTLYLTTEIEDPLGFVTTLTRDSAGRLTSMQSPAVGGARLETDYTYDADGNVATIVQDPDGLARTSTFEYDDNGNLISSHDGLGNTITRTYSATNQLLTETRYLAPDPDGTGVLTATLPITSRFVYDAEDHLRFSISAAGRVVEHRYDATGQRTTTLQYGAQTYALTGIAFDTPLSLSALTTWAATQDFTNLQRADYAYDFRGNVEIATQYAATDASGAGIGAASITRFVYDQRGRLLTTIGALGETTAGIGNDHLSSYTYDGLGRVHSMTEWVSGSSQRTTFSSYDDASRRTSVALESGLITTSQYNTAGELVSVTRGVAGDLDRFGTTSYTYDDGGRLRMVTDAAGARAFSFYDAAGRRVSTVDADGTLTEFVYDGASAVVKTIQYAERLDATTLASLVTAGIPQDVPLAILRDAADGAPASDRITRSVYDAAGRVVLSIDADGAVTQLFYDGAGRVADEVSFSTKVVIAREIDALTMGGVTLTSTASDRRTRHFYDADGNESATLDSGGYLVEYLRDPAGFLLQQIGYATRTAAQYWNAGTLEQLRPVTSVDDIRSRFFHDGQGRQIGVLDAEGYFSETEYDVAGQVVATRRYDEIVGFVEGTSTFASVRAAALAGEVRTASFEYDGLGRVTRETDHQNTITTHVYDEAGNLVSSTRALATVDERTTESRYDALGRVVQELTAEGHAQITMGMGQAAINDIWSRYGVSYAYDEAGRRISATVRPNDTQTNTTLYFYDVDGRLRFEVNALGEVSETRYDAFGQATDSIAYVGRISTASLVGGAIVQTLLDRVAVAADATRDSRSLAAYTRRGELASTSSSEGATVTYDYDAFGGNTASNERVDATRILRHEYGYDARGQLTLTRWDPTGLNTTETRTYDAFGRTISVADARGATSEFEYDRLGRQIVSIDALGVDSSVSYDAFSRTLSMVDGLGNETSYAYDDVLRTSTITTPEGIEVLSTYNRHGQTLQVTSAGNTIEYHYDLNGSLTNTSDALGSLESRAYDRSGRLVTQTNAQGTQTQFTYDAVNRTLTRSVQVPAEGLNLVTSYVYDGIGRVVDVLEPGGRLTRTTYDRDDRVVLVAVDPEGLNLRTAYEYDRMGRQVLVTEGQGSSLPRRVQYNYDMLGRLVEEIVDPYDDNPESTGDFLQLVTQYHYDQNGNLTRSVNAAGYSTWHVYDADNRLRFTLDATGGVSENSYDDAGRIGAMRRHAATIDLEPFNEVNVISEAQIEALVAPNSSDRVTRSVFDLDGREVFSINALGGVTERTFDANGNVTRTRMFAHEIAVADYATLQDVHTALTTAGNSLNTVAAADRIQWTTYDLRGRAVFAVDGLGAVTRTRYDNTGNNIGTTAFATLHSTALATDIVSLTQWAELTAIAGDEDNRTTRTWHDSVGRERFKLDAEGYLTEIRYDDIARSELAIAYASAPTGLEGDVSLEQVIAAATAVASSTADVRTLTQRDLAGRVTRVEDALQQYELYTYDALGNKASYRNKKGDVWTDEYDANRRLWLELGPEVEITHLRFPLPEEESPYHVITGTDVEPLETWYEYDALGNLRVLGVFGGLSEEASSRTTYYDYDALGRQTGTRHGSGRVYDADADIPSGYVGSYDRDNYETSRARDTATEYDVFGNAIRNIDFGGSVTHRIHDGLGRVRFEIDAEFYVTEYRYDTFGNQTELIRYLDRIPEETETFELTPEEFLPLLSADVRDRVLTTTYDRLNRAVRVEQPAVMVFNPTAGQSGGTLFTASPTTVSEYNAFGQLVKSSQLLDPNTGTWADSYSYFDERGLKSADVDALGYITTYEHDAVGNMVRSVEFARALMAGSWNLDGFGTPVAAQAGDAAGLDRVIEWSHDVLNRKIEERRVAVAYTQTLGNGTVANGVADAVTTYAYDAVGNLTRVTDPTGATTYNYYDAVGRLMGTAAPSRDSGNSTMLTPVTQMRRDAHGNLVEQTQFANATNVTAAGYTPVASASSRTSWFEVDAFDQVVISEDGNGHRREASYTARGEVGREWGRANVYDEHARLYRYDRLGRQVSIREPYGSRYYGGAEGGGFAIAETTFAYNAFGEVTAKTVNDLGGESYEYDAAGRVIRSNSGGTTTVYLYDLAGRATAEIRSQALDLSQYSIAEVAAMAQQRMRTETRYDLAGRIVEQRGPEFAAANQLNELQSVGSQLHVSDALLGPSNPDAVYVLQTEHIGYGYEDHTVIQGVLAPGVTAAQGGGYRYTGPTAADPDNGWTQDATYQLVSGRYIHWARPAEYGTAYGQQFITPLFEVRAQGSQTWTTRRVVDLPQDELGVDLTGLTGTIEYRLTYTRGDALSEYAIATGTVVIGAASVLTDTTAATLSSENRSTTSTVEEVPVNTLFRDAAFVIGDFSEMNALDSFVYRRVAVGTLVNYVIDRNATLAQEGGYYLTASGYVQKADYLPLTSRSVRWNAPADGTLVATFEFRDITSTVWQSRTPTLLSGDQFSVAIGDLADAQYQFRVVYHDAASQAVATATGVFQIESPVNDGSLSIIADPDDDTGAIAPIGDRPLGATAVSAQIVESADFNEPVTGGASYTGRNDVRVMFPSISGPVRVEIEYLTANFVAQIDSGPNGNGWPPVARRVSMVFADASAAAAGLNARWSEPAVSPDGGGVSRVTQLRVWSLDSNDEATLRYSTDPADLKALGGSTLTWRAPANPAVDTTFRYRAVGTAEWQILNETRQADEYSVDIASLAPGQWEYEVVYTLEGVERARSTGTFAIGIDAIANVVEGPVGGVYAPEPVVAVRGIETGGVQIGAVVSAMHEVTGTATPSAPRSTHWNGTNSVTLTWPNLGAVDARVVIDYTTAPRYGFNYSTGTGGWEAGAAFVPGVQTSRSLEFSGAGTGTTISWDDNDAGLVGGIDIVTRVRVYIVNGSTWALAYDRDAAAPRGGRSLYWPPADDPAVASEFAYRLAGTTGWTTLSVSTADGYELVSLDPLTAGNYEYQVRRSTGVASGTFAVAAAGAAPSTRELATTQNNVVFDRGANDFGPVAWSGSELSWSRAPDSGDSILVRSRVVGESTWQEQSISGAGPGFVAPLVASGSASVEFEVMYTHQGGSTPYARSAGTLNVNTAVTVTAGRAVLTQTAELLTSIAPVANLRAILGALAWPSQGWINPPQLRVQLASGGAWQTISVLATDDSFVADLSALAPNVYRYELRDQASGAPLPVKFASGVLTAGSGAVGGGLTLRDTTEYSNSVITQSTGGVPTTFQSIDRWGNVIALTDALGNTTNQRFNQMSSLIETRAPQVAVVDTTGNTVTESVQHPFTYNHYDLSGRLVATVDAKGNTRELTLNAAGNVLRERAADGGLIQNLYDGFDQKILVTDALGYRTSNEYDRVGQLLYVRREITLGALDQSDPQQWVASAFAYDAAGRRRYEETGGSRTTYRVSPNGNVIERASLQSGYSYFRYDALGRKTYESNANGAIARWTYDYFGRVIAHTDLGGTRYAYEYNLLGLLARQTNTLGQNLNYAYDSAGQLTSIRDTGIAAPNSGVTHSNKLTEYGYDIAGRRIVERTLVDGRVLQNSKTEYDALGRIVRVVDPDFDLTYEYDLAGNRTHIEGRYKNHSGTSSAYVQEQNLWYTYDAADRVLVSQGAESGGTIHYEIGAGILLTYNVRGDRASARTRAEHFNIHITINSSGGATPKYTRQTGLFTERYVYDGLGRLTAIDQDVPTTTHDTRNGNDTTGVTPIRVDSRTYNAASQETSATTLTMDEEDEDEEVNALNTNVRTTTYAAGKTYLQETLKNGRIIMRVTFGTANYVAGHTVSLTSAQLEAYNRSLDGYTSPSYDGSGGGGTGYGAARAISMLSQQPKVVENGSVYIPEYWTGNGYDAAGILRSYTVDYFREANGRYKYSTKHTLDYRVGESYQEIGQRASSYQGNVYSPTAEPDLSLFNPTPMPNPGSTVRTYNVNGELVAFADSKTPANNRFFANDANGNALLAIQGRFDGKDGRLSVNRAFDIAIARTGNQVKAQHFFSVNGQSLGSFGQLTDEEGAFKANFDVNYTQISEGYPASVPSSVLVQDGDTLRSVAARIFGDATLWYVLAEENGLTDPNALLEAGTQLRVPNSLQSLSNNATSFKPFDASIALGNTTPTQMFPQGGCGVVGTIILVVIAIIVAQYAAPAIANWAGAVLSQGAAAVVGSVGGAAVGSAVSQGVAIAIGMQEKFNWDALAVAAISAGVLQHTPLGNIGGMAGGKYLAAGLQGVASSVLNQGLNLMFGLQKSFDWRELAVSALASPTARYAQQKTARFGTFTSTFVAGVSGTAVRALLGGRVDVANALADAFGNALGNSIVEEIGGPPQIPRRGEQEEKPKEQPLIEEPPPAGARKELDANPDSSWFDVNIVPTRDEVREMVAANFYVDASKSSDGSDKQAYVEQEVVSTSGLRRPEFIRTVIGHNEDGDRISTTGYGIEIVGTMMPTDDVEGLEYNLSQHPVGIALNPYVDEAGNKAWGYSASNGMRYVQMTPAVTFGSIANNIGLGIGEGLWNLYTQPVAQVHDLAWEIPKDIIDNAWLGDQSRPNWWSSTGKYVESGQATTEGLILNTLGSIPVANIIPMTYGLVDSSIRRDWNGAARQVGGIALSVGVGKAIVSKSDYHLRSPFAGDLGTTLSANGFGALKGLQSPLVKPSVAATASAERLSPAALREKYGHLSAENRRALIQSKADANSESRVTGLEKRLNKAYPGLDAHFGDKHGPDIPLVPNLQQRAIDGSHPRTGDPATPPRPRPSTQFKDWRTEMHVLNEAMTRTARGLPRYNGVGPQQVRAVVGYNPQGSGRGFFPHPPTPLAPTFVPQLNGWIVRFDSRDVPFTAFATR